jgi:non-specific serine/threonine protein kinase
MIGTTLAHYEVREPLGKGGMGEVFRAFDTKLEREVAIKLIPAEMATDPDRIARFEREARTLASLQHPNIASIFGFEEAAGHRFLVMELVDGESLAERISRGPLATDQLLPIAIQIADGLAAAHAKGIVHRDLKPANVMIACDGRVKILDLGLAKAVAVGAGEMDEAEATMTLAPQLTEIGTAVGTMAYMSPEQALGRPVDARSDLFSFGAVLHEMATGRRAFAGPTQAAVIDSLLRGEPASPNSGGGPMPHALAPIVRRLLRRDPARRYASAAEVRTALASLAAGRSSEPAEDRPSIAVLPFANLSADPENEYFADGMAEEVISALSKIEALRVASRTSSFAFKNRREDVREIARALSVTAVLEGSVRRAGRRLRVAVQLVKADDGFQLWSQRFDRDLEDVFAVQDEIATSIADALRVVLTPRERQAIQRIPTDNLEAYDLYLRGRALLGELTEESIVQAQYLFRRAVELDDEFTPAWLGLAESAMWSYQWFDRSAKNRDTVAEASRRAIAVAPDLAEAHVARGMAAWLQGEAGGAIAAFERAQAIDPQLWHAPFFLARVHVTEGNLDEAARWFRRADEIRPEDYQAITLLSSLLEGIDRHDDALAAARRGVEVVERHLRLNPHDARAYYLGAGCQAVLGREDLALEWAHRALEISPRDGGVLYNVACAFLHAGLIDDALDLLERAVSEGWGNRDWLEQDPDMDPIRHHPRFRAVLDRMATQAG